MNIVVLVEEIWGLFLLNFVFGEMVHEKGHSLQHSPLRHKVQPQILPVFSRCKVRRLERCYELAEKRKASVYMCVDIFIINSE